MTHDPFTAETIRRLDQDFEEAFMALAYPSAPIILQAPTARRDANGHPDGVHKPGSDHAASYRLKDGKTGKRVTTSEVYNDEHCGMFPSRVPHRTRLVRRMLDDRLLGSHTHIERHPEAREKARHTDLHQGRPFLAQMRNRTNLAVRPARASTGIRAKVPARAMDGVDRPKDRLRAVSAIRPISFPDLAPTNDLLHKRGARKKKKLRGRCARSC